MIRSLAIMAMLSLSAFCFGEEPNVAHTAPTNRWEQFMSSQPHIEVDNFQQRLAAMDKELLQLLGQYISWEFTQYETRIDQLEDQLSSITMPQHPFQVGIHHGRYAPNPTPNPFIPQPTNAANSIRTEPQTPTAIPDAWQRLKIKGQWFYVIPVNQAAAFQASQDQGG